MENPQWWGPVVKLLNEQCDKHTLELSRGSVGESLGQSIYETLKEHGYLSDRALAEEQAHRSKKLEEAWSRLSAPDERDLKEASKLLK